MYNCKECGNTSNFIENYTDERYIYISIEGELLKSESDPQLIEVVCANCNSSTEDGNIVDKEGNNIIIE